MWMTRVSAACNLHFVFFTDALLLTFQQSMCLYSPQRLNPMFLVRDQHPQFFHALMPFFHTHPKSTFPMTTTPTTTLQSRAGTCTGRRTSTSMPWLSSTPPVPPVLRPQQTTSTPQSPGRVRTSMPAPWLPQACTYTRPPSQPRRPVTTGTLCCRRPTTRMTPNISPPRVQRPLAVQASPLSMVNTSRPKPVPLRSDPVPTDGAWWFQRVDLSRQLCHFGGEVPRLAWLFF
jgi:hypothetical protein